MIQSINEFLINVIYHLQLIILILFLKNHNKKITTL